MKGKYLLNIEWKELLLTVLFFPMSLYVSGKGSATIVSNEKIWSGDNYAAFTSLVYHNGYFYCAFRNASKHYDTSGADCGYIVLIRSVDANKWDLFIQFSENNYDLRDPKLSVTPEGELMLLTEKVQYDRGRVLSRQSCYSLIVDNDDYQVLTPINFKSSPHRNWVWNIEWIDDCAYGFTYIPYFCFVKAEDGINFDVVQRINLDNTPTEASLIKLKKKEFVSVVRSKSNALLGRYHLKFNKWVWKDLGIKLGCPELIKIKKDIYILGRTYSDKKQTSIFKLDVKTMTLINILTIDGDCDCAYPGAVYRNGFLYVSYYSGNGENSDIYLTKIRITS